MFSAAAIFLGLASYAFVLLAIFRLFRINYFNPIVKIFTTYLEPLSKSIFFFMPPLFAAISLALLLDFSSLYIELSKKYELLQIFYISLINLVNTGFRILLYCVVGSVVLSWVAPGSNHPLLQIVDDISDRVLNPIRRFLPPMGGLDFTPIIGILGLNLIASSFIQIINSLQ